MKEGEERKKEKKRKEQRNKVKKIEGKRGKGKVKYRKRIVIKGGKGRRKERTGRNEGFVGLLLIDKKRRKEMEENERGKVRKGKEKCGKR